MEYSRPYFRLCAATFAGGAITFLAISLISPEHGAKGTGVATLCGALLGFILAEPVAFVRAIPPVLRTSAPYLLGALVVCREILVAIVEGMWECIRNVFTPRPVLWIAYGIPMWWVVWKNGDPYLWLTMTSEEGLRP